MKNSYILLAIPMESEFEALKRAIGAKLVRKTIGGIKGYEFDSPKGKVYAYPSKIGRVNTAFDLGQLSKLIEIKMIINLGTAGALSPLVKPLDVVVASSSAYYDVDIRPFYKYGQMAGCPLTFKTTIPPLELVNLDFKVHIGLILTAESFMSGDKVDYNILRQFPDPLCLDMEGAAFGQCAYKMNKPYVLIRAISDDATSKDNSLTHDELVGRSTDNAVKVLLKALGM